MLTLLLSIPPADAIYIGGGGLLTVLLIILIVVLILRNLR